MRISGKRMRISKKKDEVTRKKHLVHAFHNNSFLSYRAKEKFEIIEFS